MSSNYPIGAQIERPPIRSSAPLLDALERIGGMVEGGLISRDEVRGVVRRLIHSPVIGAIVAATPTPADDVALQLLRALLPPA